MAGPPPTLFLLLAALLSSASALEPGDAHNFNIDREAICSGPGFFLREPPPAEGEPERAPLTRRFSHLVTEVDGMPGTFRLSVSEEDRERCLADNGIMSMIAANQDLQVVPIPPGETHLTPAELERRFSLPLIRLGELAVPGNAMKVFENSRALFGLPEMGRDELIRVLVSPTGRLPAGSHELLLMGDQRWQGYNALNPVLIGVRQAEPPPQPEVPLEQPSGWSWSGIKSALSSYVPDSVTSAVHTARNYVGDATKGAINTLYGLVTGARGLPWAGWLENGEPLEPRQGPGYNSVKYARWGTPAMIQLIKDAGRSVVAAGCPAFNVGDISAQYGRTLGGHKSHQNGLDADIYFIGGHGAGYDARCNRVLGRALSTNRTEFLIIAPDRLQQSGPFPVRVLAQPDHWNHFHVRLKNA